MLSISIISYVHIQDISTYDVLIHLVFKMRPKKICTLKDMWFLCVFHEKATFCSFSLLFYTCLSRTSYIFAVKNDLFCIFFHTKYAIKRSIFYGIWMHYNEITNSFKSVDLSNFYSFLFYTQQSMCDDVDCRL